MEALMKRWRDVSEEAGRGGRGRVTRTAADKKKEEKD